jgi:hypothetical protein
MKPTTYRRIRRRNPSHETAAAKRESKQDQFFTGLASPSSFFPPAPSIHRKCENCEKEDKKVQREPDKKEEDQKVMRAEEAKEEEKVQRAAEKKEEEKNVMRAEDKKEQEQIQRAPEKKEKIMKAAEDDTPQKEPDHGEDEEKKLQKKEAGASVAPAKSVSMYIGSLNGKGNALPSETNHFFSARMGYDFSQVRIHTDKSAAESAKDVRAKAYAIGHHIVFNEGQYDTQSGTGKKLLAHELAHVVQQNGSSAILQRIACEGTPTAPPRAAQGTRNALDARAQAIIGLASGTGSVESKAVSVVTQIICQYYPNDAAIVSGVRYNGSLQGLDTTSVGRGATTTGTIGVGDYFVQNTTAAYFARRVLQVGHELQHIRQYRSGLAGENKKDEREFLAFAENGLADEFEGTGRMSRSTRLAIIDAAIGYYQCFSAELKSRHRSRFAEVRTRRQQIVTTGRVSEPGAEPSACARASN